MSDQTLIPEPEVDFWKQVEEAEKLGGGGGTVTKVKIGFGWKVFVKGSGQNQEESLFPYNIGDKEDNKRAKALANKFVVANGLTANPSNVFYIKLFKDFVRGKETSWKSDRLAFFFPTSKFYVDIVSAHLREAFIGKSPRLGEMWAKVSWATDEEGKTRSVQVLDQDKNPVVDEDGNPVMEDRKPIQPYIVAVYDNEEEALKDNGITSEEHLDSDEVMMDLPSGYDAESWAETSKELKAELAKGTKAKQLADDYGLPLEIVEALA
jgi:hypothetical protein